MQTLYDFSLNMSRRGFLKGLGLGGVRTGQEAVVETVKKQNPISKLLGLKKKVEKASDYAATAKPMTRRNFLKGAGRETVREVTDDPEAALRKLKMAARLANRASMIFPNTM